MVSRALRSSVIVILLVLVNRVPAGALDGDSPTTTSVAPTTTILVPTTIPDDSYTLFPGWSTDDFGYLAPEDDPVTTPSTGSDTAPLAFLSAAALVLGTALTVRTRSRGQRGISRH